MPEAIDSSGGKPKPSSRLGNSNAAGLRVEPRQLGLRPVADPLDAVARGRGDAVRGAARLAPDVALTLTAAIDGLPPPAETPEGTSVNVLSGPQLSDLGDGTTYFSTRVDVAKA